MLYRVIPLQPFKCISLLIGAQWYGLLFLVSWIWCVHKASLSVKQFYFVWDTSKSTDECAGEPLVSTGTVASCTDVYTEASPSQAYAPGAFLTALSPASTTATLDEDSDEDSNFFTMTEPAPGPITQQDAKVCHSVQLSLALVSTRWHWFVSIWTIIKSTKCQWMNGAAISASFCNKHGCIFTRAPRSWQFVVQFLTPSRMDATIVLSIFDHAFGQTKLIMHSLGLWLVKLCMHVQMGSVTAKAWGMICKCTETCEGVRFAILAIT